MIASPLTDMLQKDNFVWTEVTYKAFKDLKKALCSAPILALPNLSKPFIVEIDALRTGIGAVFLQDKHLIAYFSKKLPLHLRKASTYVWELYASVESVKKW